MFSQFCNAYKSAMKNKDDVYMIPEDAYILCAGGSDYWLGDETKKFEQDHKFLVKTMKGEEVDVEWSKHVDSGDYKETKQAVPSAYDEGFNPISDPDDSDDDVLVLLDSPKSTPTTPTTTTTDDNFLDLCLDPPKSTPPTPGVSKEELEDLLKSMELLTVSMSYEDMVHVYNMVFGFD